MLYKVRRRLYSQNFLRNPKLVAKLIRLSSIGKNDTVLEVGPGKGNITQELLKVVRKVIAVELDEKLHFYLKNKFKSAKNLELIRDDFLSFRLPPYPYKVFANIPFVITADTIKKLTSDENFQEGYLIVQKEAAKKFIGKPLDSKNQMMSTLLKPWFDIDIFWKFNRSDFVPRPHVDAAMIQIKRVKNPLIEDKYKDLYEDFIVYIYNRSKIAKLEFSDTLELFDNFLKDSNPNQKRVVIQEAQRIQKLQGSIQKIHRTRTDRNWRKFK